MSRPPLLFSVVVIAFVAGVAHLSGCKVLGLAAAACDPDDPSTCPDGQVCNADALCEPGSAPGAGEGEGEGEAPAEGEGEGEDGAGGEGEGEGAPVFASEAGVALVAIDDDGQVFFASDRADGCIRRAPAAGGAAVDVVCETGGRRVMNLALAGGDLVFLSDGDGATDRVRVIDKDATAGDAAVTVSDVDEDLGSLATRGAGSLAVRVEGPVQYVAWLAPEGEFEIVHGVALQAGVVLRRFSFGDSVARQAGGLSLSSRYLGVGCTVAGRVRLCMHDGYRTTDGSVGIQFGVGRTRGGELLDGRAGAAIGIADENIWGTRGDDDSGGVFGFDDDSTEDGSAEARTIAQRADPQNPRTYASGFASDGFSLLWGTAGVVQAGRSFGVFAVDLADEAAVPVRIADLDNPAAGVATRDGVVYVAVPADGQLLAIPLP